MQQLMRLEGKHAARHERQGLTDDMPVEARRSPGKAGTSPGNAGPFTGGPRHSSVRAELVEAPRAHFDRLSANGIEWSASVEYRSDLEIRSDLERRPDLVRRPDFVRRPHLERRSGQAFRELVPR